MSIYINIKLKLNTNANFITKANFVWFNWIKKTININARLELNISAEFNIQIGAG